MEFENLIIEASLKAGAEIIDVYQRKISVEEKDDKSPLTEADKRSHLAIQAALDTTDIPTLSEEGKQMDYSVRSGWNKFWLVDPLDGTKEFIKKNGEFTVNIALIENGAPIYGVIYAPVLKKLFVGEVGKGAWIAEGVETNTPVQDIYSKKESIPKSKPAEPYIVVASRSHFSPETQEFVDGLKEDKGEIEFTSMGSSLKICLVAEGSADIYPRFGPTMEWDTGAGHAIVRAAGKKVIDHTTGEEMRYNKENLLNNWFIVQ
ncbi:MAG: 3'(2'),5'-bisphosphate nucleotidase CysQ [Flavobacteriales bacterium]|jgi:3'(2'), 5'-bisphosphate nucleotidase|nr:3'(2'),5'-bisphosphate nucleotidase CysQ [Flavobacteriales bacterium]NCG30458.1 3'(2'),5'-bisphosphate nucleotidase CysQ [Bacteroidota bacterium]MBT3964266.1 3'(2'),5'-bisphosphate nucleotidase CysQ [Flavobacteriales bacterium]MBT4705913.1 3'(2'),5'-bisphosphate nucleotidase CysQ [Flavobacteriales bacterium]MBT4929581.1 3'(2'),5'-bisphosphate nucleotidase CysQ [Flavobacteriales bacterium]